MSAPDFFQQFGMRPVDSAGFDAALDSAGEALVGVYFWDTDCFNCDQFKKAAASSAASPAGRAGRPSKKRCRTCTGASGPLKKRLEMRDRTHN
jgi:hypothetical protein